MSYSKEFDDAFDKTFGPMVMKKLEEKMFGSTKERASMIAEKYQGLSPEELSSLVLEGEEVFIKHKKSNEPNIICHNHDMNRYPFSEAFLEGCKRFSVDKMYVGRRVVGGGYWIEMDEENYIVYDKDIQYYLNNSHVYFSEIVTRV